MPALVVKLGSSIVAEDSGELRLSVVARICEEVADLHRSGVDVVIVTSGAIARGRHLLEMPLRPTAIEELAQKQARILHAAARLVKHGGRLVYATCSILQEENEAIVEAFQRAAPEFKPLSCAALLAAQKIPLDTGERLRLWPHMHGTDGFFAAAFERTS